MLRASDCRAGARRALSGHWKIAILAGILVTFVTSGTVAGLGLEVDFDCSGLGLIAGLDLPPFISSDEYISLAEIWLPIGIGSYRFMKKSGTRRRSFLKEIAFWNTSQS